MLVRIKLSYFYCNSVSPYWSYPHTLKQATLIASWYNLALSFGFYESIGMYSSYSLLNLECQYRLSNWVVRWTKRKQRFMLVAKRSFSFYVKLLHSFAQLPIRIGISKLRKTVNAYLRCKCVCIMSRGDSHC